MSYIGTEPKDIRSFGRTKFDYTATQGQTAFTGADDDGKVLAFTVGQIEVYVNGILMDDSDFTTTGTGTVTLASAANLNDVVNVVSFETNIPDSNYVPATGGTFTSGVTVQGTVAATAYTGDGSNLTGTGSPSIDDNGNANAITIDASENVMVGKTSTNSDTVGVEILPAGQVYVTANNTLPFYINRKGTSGNNEFARFSDDGATRGTIASSFAEELTISASGANSSGILFSQSNQVRPMKNGATSNGTQDLGAGNGAWKDLYLSGGAYIGGTGAANKLDDYEEGTFTATLAGYYGNPSSTVTATGLYTKVGNKVEIMINMDNVNTSGASGDMWITGLPFASSGVYCILPCQMNSAGTFPNSSPFGLVSGNICYFYKHASNAGASAVYHNAGTSRTIRVTGNYRVA